MKITMDDKYAQEVRSKIMAYYAKEGARENKARTKDKLYHVSDIVFPRKYFYEQKYGRKITDAFLGLWISGKAFGSVFQEALGKDNSEVPVRMGQFVAHVDYFDAKVLLEIKTSRKWTIPEIPEPHYVRQLGYYCTMTGMEHGKLYVVYFTAGRKWGGQAPSTLEMRAWDVGFSQDELLYVKKDMEITVKKIEAAIKAGTPAGLPPVPGWLLSEFPDADPGKYTKKYQEQARLSPFNFVDIQVKANETTRK